MLCYCICARIWRRHRPKTRILVMYLSSSRCVNNTIMQSDVRVWRSSLICASERHHGQSETHRRQRQQTRVRLQQLRQQRSAEGRRGGEAAADADGHRQRRQEQLARRLQVSPAACRSIHTAGFLTERVELDAWRRKKSCVQSRLLYRSGGHGAPLAALAWHPTVASCR